MFNYLKFVKFRVVQSEIRPIFAPQDSREDIVACLPPGKKDG
jgi:hypothetical protein